MKKEDVVLGNKVKDIITGFEGIATSKVEFLNGCIQYCVKPIIGTDGKMPEGEYIDQQQLVVIGQGVAIESKGTGGIMSDTPKGHGMSRS